MDCVKRQIVARFFTGPLCSRQPLAKLVYETTENLGVRRILTAVAAYTLPAYGRVAACYALAKE
jgi:hypothetical protein